MPPTYHHLRGAARTDSQDFKSCASLVIRCRWYTTGQKEPVSIGILSDKKGRPITGATSPNRCCVTQHPTPVYHRWRHHLYREGRNIDARTVSKIINVKIPPIVRGRSIIARIPSRGRREKTRPAGTPHDPNIQQYVEAMRADNDMSSIMYGLSGPGKKLGRTKHTIKKTNPARA